MDWTQVIDFITRRDAALAASFVGVGQKEIDAIQVELGITLPSLYVDFLRTMGESSGELHAFGQTHVHAFSELYPPGASLEQPTSKSWRGYETGRFFQVAIWTEGATDPIDPYLDLSRSDGQDAPLVDLEATSEPATPAFSEDHLSFAERLVYRIFRTLGPARTSLNQRVAVCGAGSEECGAIKREALQLLTRSGFSAVLPDLRRVGCMARGATSVLLSVSQTSRLVTFEVGGDGREDVDRVVADLLTTKSLTG